MNASPNSIGDDYADKGKDFFNRGINFFMGIVAEPINVCVQYKTYCTKEKIVHGLPIALITTVALSSLFELTNTSNALAFGTVSYSLLSLFKDFNGFKLTSERAFRMTVISGFLTKIILNSYSNTPPGYLASSFLLPLGAYLGQAAREYFKKPSTEKS